MNNIISFLNQDSYQIYNRHVAKYFKSVNAAIMLSELINRYDYHTAQKELTSHEKYGDGWFYFTCDKAEERTYLSRKEQDTALKILKEKGFIESKVFGLPAKRYFKINEEKIIETFFSKKDSSMSKKDNLELKKSTTYEGEKRQTAHIYKEPHKDPYVGTSTTNEQLVDDDVVHKYAIEEEESESEKNISESEESNASKLKSYIKKRSPEWGDEWDLPLDLFEFLIEKYGIAYVTDQISYMLSQHNQSILDSKASYKKKKVPPVVKPDSYLKISCDKNWAQSKFK